MIDSERKTYIVAFDWNGQLWVLRVLGRPFLRTEVRFLEDAADSVRDEIVIHTHIPRDSFDAVIEQVGGDGGRTSRDENLASTRSTFRHPPLRGPTRVPAVPTAASRAGATAGSS